MSDELADFAATLRGDGGGALTGALRSVASEMEKFVEAADRAKASTAELQEMLAVFVGRQVRTFIGDFGVMLGALSEGLGSDSPAVAAAKNVLAIGEALRGFVADTKLAVEITGADPQAIAAAELAARSYALTLLETAPELSEVETRLRTLQGTAVHLRALLEDLGMSASEAGRAVADGINWALNDIRADFERDLRARLNAALGKGYLNDITELITEGASLLNDAILLGVGRDDVGRYFAAQAQAVVDGAELTGEAFEELIDLFPNLAGVVHQAAAAIEQSMQQINRTAGTVLDYVRGLFTGSDTTLAPGDRLTAARTTYDRQLALARAGNADAQAGITVFADDLLNAARTMFASSADFQEVFDEVTRALLNLPSVQQTDDLVVLALRESITEIIGVRGAIGALPSQIADSLLPHFERLDADLDGLLSATELAGLGTIEEINALIGAVDVNSDRQISKLELIGAGFDRLDADLNGLLSATELAGLDTVEEIKALIAAVDSNGDGQISKLELVAAASLSTKRAVGDVDDNTAAALGLLEAVRSVQNTTKDISNTISQSILQLGTVTEDINIAIADNYFGPMVGYLEQIAEYTREMAGGEEREVRFPLLGRLFPRLFGGYEAAEGGLIPMPGYDSGGLIGNGIWNRDSVAARFANGGSVMLAGGEFVTRAPSVNSATYAALDHINRTGAVHSNDNSRQNFVDLMRVIQTSTNAQMLTLREEMARLREDVREVSRTVRSQQDRPRKVGTKAA